MKRFALTNLVVICMLLVTTTNAQVSGTVFKDFNFTGTRELVTFPIEPGVYGVLVKAYNAAGAQLGTTKTSDVNGAFSFTAAEIPSGTAIRIEFTPLAGTFDAKTGTENGSAVQFLTAPSNIANYAIASQEWYSQTANPFLATTGFTNGDANTSGVGSPGANPNLYIFPYNMGNGTGTADDGGATRRRPNSELGAVYGLTYQRITRTLLMSAYIKRHTGLGVKGIGAIYKTTVDGTGVPGAASLLVDLTTIGIVLGTDPHTGLPALSNTRNADPNTFAAIGKTGIGGIDLSEDGKTLYVVNMFQNKLHKIDVGTPLKTTFSAADVTGTYNITGPSGSLNWHPMACKVANGKVYIGGVYVAEKTTAHNLATDTVGARGIVYEFDPATSVFTQVLSYPFNYRRGFSNSDFRYPFKCNWWCAWQNNGAGGVGDPMQADYNTATGAFTGGIYYPQPMLSDIEFDVDGSMIIGIRDRFGDQIGYQNVSTDNLPGAGGFASSPNNWFRGLTSGEVLRAGKDLVGSNYTLENRGQATNLGVTTGTLDQVGAGNTANAGTWNPAATTPWGGQYGPGWGGTAATPNAGGPNQGTQGGYFYYNHNFSASGTGTNGLGAATVLNGTPANAISAHYMKSLGTIALLAGSNEVVTDLMDPVNTSFANGAARMINSGTNAGNMAQRLQLVVTTAGDPTNGGKSNGMGDLELLTDYQPIEVGNRVWDDANGNGVQDAGEAGIGAVTVELWSPGPDAIFGNADDVKVATTTTATTGAIGTYNFNTLTTVDARKPVSWTGVTADAILSGFDYQIRVPATQANLTTPGYKITQSNNNSNALDNIDNDAISLTTSGGVNNAVIDFNTTVTNHNFDIGFSKPASLGNRVWLDNGAGTGGVAADGLQNGSEPGVAGVTVTLFDAAGTAVGTTITDTYGNYLFSNLAPGNYTVGFTLPPNYTFTTQTNTADDGNTTGTGATAASINGSDVNSTTGKTYTVTLSAGENNNNVDAGLIFTSPVLPNSIGDKVWFDANNNGTNDGGAAEPGVSGVTVTLYDATGTNIIAVTTTDVNGNYIFNNLPANTSYIIGITPPAGTLVTGTANTVDATNASTNCDVNATIGAANYGRTPAAVNTGVAGTQITGIDAGLKNDPKGALGDFVWNDLNRDGIQGAGEPGIPGVTMQLYNPGGDGLIGTADDAIVSTTTTDANGYYNFPNLDPGKYFVVATRPAGYTNTIKNAGTDVTKDCDFANQATGTYAGKSISSIKILGSAAGGLTRDMTVDLGLYSNAMVNTLNTLGDKVFNDINRDGLQTAGEPGVPNVTVRLLTAAGVAVNNPATGKPYVTITDANGNYKFVDLADGNYIVEFANIPATYSFTGKDASGTGNAGSATDGTNDSDADGTTGRTSVINLDAASASATSVNIVNVDAGISQGIPAGKGSLGNRVWYDLNNNGIQDAGEPGGVSGVTVNLYKDANGDGVLSGGELTAVATTTTNALGEYLFGGLDAGSYQVGFSTLPLGYSLSAKDQGADDTKDSDGNAFNTSVNGNTAAAGTSYTALISLATGEDNLTADLGIVPAAGTNTLGNFVWNDNGQGSGVASNGIQDGTEAGVQGVMVTLQNADGSLYDKDPGTAGVQPYITVTDANGAYLFAGLPDGLYRVTFSNLPAGYSITTKDANAEAAGTDSDADLTSGITGVYDLDAAGVSAAGINETKVDGGLITTRASLGDLVWLDSNGDGVKDATETGISGVTVTLFASDGTTVIASTVTDANGKYLFPNIAAGSYIAGFTTTPGNLEFTKQNTPGDNGNNTNSDADVLTGKTGIFVLTAGENELTADAGLRPKQIASVGDFVWLDKNGNGVQDLGEPGVPGVLVTLYDAANNVLGTAITDGNGAYLISNVPPGINYYIIFSNKPGTATFTTQTSDVSAGDITKGSDANVTTGRTAAFTLTAGQYLQTVDAGLQQVQLLPVRGLELTAVLKASTAAVKWITQNEINTSRFYIERSVDGRNFVSTGNVAAAGNNSGTLTYNFNDDVSTLLKYPVIYYRIKAVDADGSFSYSNIAIVKPATAGSISIWPNPVTDKANVSLFSTDAGMVQLRLMDYAGQTIRVTNFPVIKGNNQLEVGNLNQLANGTYILQITAANGTDRLTEKIIKK